MKVLKIFGIVIGSIVVLVIIVGVIFWVLLSRAPSLASQVSAVPSDSQAAQSLDSKWAALQNTVSQAPSGTPITITLTQEEVNSKINEELNTANLPAGFTINNLNVNLKNGEILLSANVKYSIFTGIAAMEATVQAVNGQPTITVTDIDMGALPIPQSLKDQLKKLIPEDSLFQSPNSGFYTQSVQITNEQLVISGVTQ